MKTKHSVILSCIVIAGLILSGMALADSPAQSERRGFGFNRHHKGGSLTLLAKYQQKNLMIQALSELSGQPSEDIEAKLKDQRMRSVMQELNIDRQALRSAMHTKISQRVKSAAADGSITAEQEKEIIDSRTFF